VYCGYDCRPYCFFVSLADCMDGFISLDLKSGKFICDTPQACQPLPEYALCYDYASNLREVIENLEVRGGIE
jgi:hypothetical protein